MIQRPLDPINARSSFSQAYSFQVSPGQRHASVPHDDDDDVVVFLFTQFNSNQSIILQVCVGPLLLLLSLLLFCCFCNAIFDVVVVVIKGTLIVSFSKGEDWVVSFESSGFLLRRNK